MPEPLTANQVVAYNLMRVRKMLGLSQEQAAERLEPHIGARWSKAVYSAAERSFHGNRVRQFTADDLGAFALAFGVPVSYFFVPPKPEDREGSGPQPELFKVMLGGENTGAVLMRTAELPLDEVPRNLRLRLYYTYSAENLARQFARGTDVPGEEILRAVMWEDWPDPSPEAETHSKDTDQ